MKFHRKLTPSTRLRSMLAHLLVDRKLVYSPGLFLLPSVFLTTKSLLSTMKGAGRVALLKTIDWGLGLINARKFLQNQLVRRPRLFCKFNLVDHIPYKFPFWPTIVYLDVMLRKLRKKNTGDRDFKRANNACEDITTKPDWYPTKEISGRWKMSTNKKSLLRVSICICLGCFLGWRL